MCFVSDEVAPTAVHLWSPKGYGCCYSPNQDYCMVMSSIFSGAIYYIFVLSWGFLRGGFDPTIVLQCCRRGFRRTPTNHTTDISGLVLSTGGFQGLSNFGFPHPHSPNKYIISNLSLHVKFFSFFFSFILLEIFPLWTSWFIPFSFLFFHDDTLFFVKFFYWNVFCLIGISSRPP